MAPSNELLSESKNSSSVQNENLGVRSMNGSDLSTINDNRNDFGDQIDEFRFLDLIHALKRLARLRAVASTSSVHARQKKREASIKRQNVWFWDGKFMEEIQRLVAHGKLKEFEDLQRLAKRCQSSRDGLGPVEQEAIETEQEFEGKSWKLQQAEEEFDFDFQHEFEVADSYPALPISVRSSSSQDNKSVSDVDDTKEDSAETLPPFHSTLFDSFENHTSSNFEVDSNITQIEKISSVFGADGAEQQDYPAGSQIPDSDSGFGDIDDKIAYPVFGDSMRVPPDVKRTHPASNEFYPHLLTEFESSRDRINRWLQNTVLQSRFEGVTLYNILARKLELENRRLPSNWAQLVMAYWEMDGASRATALHEQDPQVEESLDIPPSAKEETPFCFNEEEGLEHPSAPSRLRTSTSENAWNSHEPSGVSFTSELRSRRLSTDATISTAIGKETYSNWVPSRRVPPSRLVPSLVRRSRSASNLQASADNIEAQTSSFEPP